MDRASYCVNTLTIEVGTSSEPGVDQNCDRAHYAAKVGTSDLVWYWVEYPQTPATGPTDGAPVFYTTNRRTTRTSTGMLRFALVYRLNTLYHPACNSRT